MGHDIRFGNCNRENGPTILDLPLFLGIFHWDEPETAWEIGRRLTGTRHGNVYLSVREKQQIVVYRAMCFTKSDISGCGFTSILRTGPPEIRKC